MPLTHLIHIMRQEQTLFLGRSFAAISNKQGPSQHFQVGASLALAMVSRFAATIVCGTFRTIPAQSKVSAQLQQAAVRLVCHSGEGPNKIIVYQQNCIWTKKETRY
jgi:hypothetical protein